MEILENEERRMACAENHFDPRPWDWWGEIPAGDQPCGVEVCRTIQVSARIGFFLGSL